MCLTLHGTLQIFLLSQRPQHPQEQAPRHSYILRSNKAKELGSLTHLLSDHSHQTLIDTRRMKPRSFQAQVLPYLRAMP